VEFAVTRYEGTARDESPGRLVGPVGVAVDASWADEVDVLVRRFAKRDGLADADGRGNREERPEERRIMNPIPLRNPRRLMPNPPLRAWLESRGQVHSLGVGGLGAKWTTIGRTHRPLRRAVATATH
jgi:hypothetical protein